MTQPARTDAAPAPAPADERPAPPRLPPGTAAVLALLLLVGGAATALRLFRVDVTGPTPADVDLRVPDWRATPRELTALEAVARARLAAAPADDRPQVQTLTQAYLAYNAADLRHKGSRKSDGLADAAADYQQRAVEFLHHVGAEPYMGLGQRFVDRFMAALEAGDAAEVERLGGTFLSEARATGLVDAAGRVVAGMGPVVRAAFAWRWAAAVSDTVPADTLLAAEEREILLRWKLAAHPLVTPDRRREMARALEVLRSTYPIDEALAARAADEGRWPEAARLYERAAAARPSDPRLRANAAYAAARAQPQPRAPR